MRFLVLAAPLCLASALSADVRTVGPPGSGADFKQIQPAIDASAPGDVVLVDAGVYEGFTLTKPLLVQGAGPDSTTVEAGFLLVTAIRVSAIPAGEVAVVAGMSVRDNEIPALGLGTLEADSSAGSVILHDVRGAAGEACNVALLDVGRALTSRASLIGTWAYSYTLNATRSRLWVLDSTLALPEAVLGSSGWQVTTARLVECEATFAGTDVQGGDVGWIYNFGGWALELQRSLVFHARGAVTGGDGEELGAGGEAARVLDGSALFAATDTVLQGGVDASGLFLQPPVTVSADSNYVSLAGALPTLSASAARAGAGDTLTLTLRGDPADTGTLVGSVRPGVGLALTGVFGELFIDPAAPISLGEVTLDASGEAQVSVTVPALGEPSLATFQWARGGGSIELSNPAFVSLR